MVYLLVLAFRIQESQATTANIISILIMSALIGLFTLLFEGFFLVTTVNDSFFPNFNCSLCDDDL